MMITSHGKRSTMKIFKKNNGKNNDSHIKIIIQLKLKLSKENNTFMKRENLKLKLKQLKPNCKRNKRRSEKHRENKNNNEGT